MRVLGRLGIGLLVEDHRRTLVEYDADGRSHRSAADYIVFVGFPVGVGLAVGFGGVELRSIDALLTGVSILTGLLFGLLVHVLQLGLTVVHEGRAAPGSLLVRLSEELRANVAWACAVGLLLVGILVLIGSFTVDVSQGVSSWLTAIVVALTLHLGMTLLMILKRVRATYRLLGR